MKEKTIEQKIEARTREYERKKLRTEIEERLQNMTVKRDEFVKQYVRVSEKYGPENPSTIITAKLLEAFENIYVVVEQVLTVQEALLSIEDLMSIMDTTTEAMNFLFDSRNQTPTQGFFYRLSLKRKIKKYVKKCKNQIESTMKMSEALANEFSGINFGKKDKKSTRVDENEFSDDLKARIQAVRAEQGVASQIENNDDAENSSDSDNTDIGNTSFL